LCWFWRVSSRGRSINSPYPCSNGIRSIRRSSPSKRSAPMRTFWRHQIRYKNSIIRKSIKNNCGEVLGLLNKSTKTINRRGWGVHNISFIEELI
jgi:hypothetical protein